MSQEPPADETPVFRPERVSLNEKSNLLRRIRKLDFPPDDQLDETLRLRLPSILDASRRPTVLDYALIAHATGVTVTYLFSGNEDPEPEDAREELIESLMAGGMSRRWAERQLAAYNRQLAGKILNYPRTDRPACGNTQHCAFHGWCHRCDPERAGMDRAARIVKYTRSREQ